MTAVEQALAAYLQALKDLHAAANRASEAQVNYDTAKALEKAKSNPGISTKRSGAKGV